MLADRTLIQNMLRVNGLTPTSADQDLRAMLAVAGFAPGEMDAAITLARTPEPARPDIPRDAAPPLAPEPTVVPAFAARYAKQQLGKHHRTAEVKVLHTLLVVLAVGIAGAVLYVSGAAVIFAKALNLPELCSLAYRASDSASCEARFAPL